LSTEIILSGYTNQQARHTYYISKKDNSKAENTLVEQTISCVIHTGVNSYKLTDSSFASAQLVKVIRFSGYRVATLSGLNVSVTSIKPDNLKPDNLTTSQL
jgi:hypothetical protein